MTTIIDLIYIYVRECPLTVTCGKVHEYLGRTIDYPKKYNVKFTMYENMSDMIEDLPEDTKTGE